jgi:anti-sigma factor RsiW
MDCSNVRESLILLQDGWVTEADRRALDAHLSGCAECARLREQYAAVRSSLRALPRKPVPHNVSMALRVTASKEASRRRAYAGFFGRLNEVREHFQLHMNHLMRPLALPAAGGLLSAVFLFTAMMPNLFTARTKSWDVPIAIATDAQVKSSTLLEMSEAEIFIDILVDENGRVIDYALPEGSGLPKSSLIRRRLENTLLFTEFNPATTFGRPVPGWVRVNFRGIEIDVKG